MKRIAFVLFLAFALMSLLAPAALAQTGSQTQQTPEKYLELLRRNVRTDKVAIMTEALDLPQAKADLFWPIYREYEKEIATLGDRGVALVKKYAAQYGQLTDQGASEIMKEWFSIKKARTDVLQKYHAKVEKAVGGLIAGQFVQVENVLGMLIDIQIAAEIPLLE